MSKLNEAQLLRSLFDRATITDVVTAWAFARDSGRWDRLRACFSAQATMHTTWFVGSADDFVERSIAASKGPARGQHFIGACAVELNGDRALAETRMTLLLRAPLDGVVVDVTCYGRFYDHFIRQDGVWRIRKRVPIYEKDRLDPVDPTAKVMLDRADLERHPEGYRHIAYVQSRGGSQVTPGLPTPGSDALARLYAEGDAWLAGAS
ncbi:MAG: nuclear transport factor 2 family protein [Variovorax sp.]